MSPFRFIQSQPRGSDAEQTVESNVHDTAANRALPARGGAIFTNFFAGAAQNQWRQGAVDAT